MKQFIPLFLLLQLHIFVQSQSVPLPVVKQGKWFLVDGAREIRLPDSYSGVGLFDGKGTARFSQYNQYGVLGQNGNELIPAKYFSIVSLGNGYYECAASSGTELLYATEAEKIGISCDSIVQLQPSWISFQKDSSRFVLNTVSRKEIALDSAQAMISAQFDYLLVYRDSMHIALFDPRGELLSEDSVYLDDHDFWFEYHSARLRLLVDGRGAYEISPKASNVWISDDRIHYSLNGTAFLLDRESRAVIASVQGERISVFDDRYYTITRKGSIGLMDKAGKIVLPPEYSYIWKGEDFYRVTQNEKSGLLDLQFRKIVPCTYKYLLLDQKFIHTHSIIDGKGLISRITGKEILRPMYERISVENTVIKAWANGNLSIVEITPQHQVKDKFMLNNAITLIARSSTAGTIRERIDYRLFPLGWFCDSVITYDTLKSVSRVHYKWGIQTASDSVLVQPRLKQPLFVPGAPVSLLYAQREAIKMNYQFNEEVNVYTFMNFSTGKRTADLKIIDLDSTDFSLRGYARFCHTKGSGILRTDGTVVQVAHIDHSEEDLLRVCYRGTEHLREKKSAQTLDILTRRFNTPAYAYQVKSGDKRYRYIEYENARWNFLDNNGNARFKDSFTFAQKFYKQTAIVQAAEGWGAVCSDSVIVPMRFASIRRVPEYSDTVFMVMANVPGKTYFDSLLQPLSSFPGKFEKQKGNLALYTQNGSSKIFGKDYAVVSEGSKSCYLYEFDRFAVKNKKVYEIYDVQGKSLGETPVKPDEFLDGDFFTAGSSGKMGLMSAGGDTVVPFIFSSIEKTGNHFLAKGKSQNHLYSPDGTLISGAPLTILLVDSISGNRAEISEGKITVFDAAGKKIARLKSDLKLIYYFNETLFSEQDNYTILKADGTEILPGQDFTEVMFLENGFCALHHADQKWLLFDAEWKPVAQDISGIRKIRQLGAHVLSLQLKNELVLLDLDNREIHTGFARVNGEFENGFLLVYTSGKSRWSFINRDFEDVFKRSFSRAKPFRNGYACVADASGWTIIGEDGLPKSLPSYGDLEQTGHRIFRMSMLPVYGLIDSHGKAILEPVYEKITLLPGNLIQVIRDGKIGYHDYQGKVIYSGQ